MKRSVGRLLEGLSVVSLSAWTLTAAPARAACPSAVPAPTNDVTKDMELGVPLGYGLYPNLKIFTVLWGEHWDDIPGNFSKADIDKALRTVVSSPYFDNLCQYGVPGFQYEGIAGTDGAVFCPANPGAVTSTPALFGFMSCEEYSLGTGVPPAVGLPNPACVSCAALPIDCLDPLEVLCLATPNPTGNRVYVLLLPKGTVISDFGSVSCAQGGYNAYHFQIPSRALLSLVPPFVIPGTQGRPLNLAVVPTECFATLPDLIAGITHEVVEAATDPLPLASWIDYSSASPGGTFDITQVGSLFKEGEAADLCASEPKPSFTAADGTTVKVAPYWSNHDNQCVSLDVDSPTTAAASAPPVAQGGWNAGAVTVTLTATDTGTPTSGVRQIVHNTTGAELIAPTTTAGASATVVISAEGVTIVHFHAEDNAGNAEADQTLTVRIDRTAPMIAGAAAPPPNGAGWNRTNVMVTFTCSDVPSGIASCTPPVTLSVEGIGLSATGTAVDLAGNTASATVGGLRIDLTPPVVAYTGNAGTYTVDQAVNIVCTATDNLSGIASTTCADVVATAFTFGLGDHPFSATATDFAGNTGGGSTSFTVEATPASLCTLTRMFSTKPRIGDSLCAKLDGAASAASPSARAGMIDAFINEVNAQSGKAFDPSEATLLIGFASAL